ncbi:4Fe-4S dicluster domain-containing protein [Meiothermus hypogaeus]|uniref:Ferredoxin n=2 Tax=Meiothermus hypogaeus TaxID=884155 RepID=A0A511R4B6_9DEIN|nr:ferredoxin family protein [Meiothermus hypogaeus]RIH77478.1 Ferredoxin [Meiothermus hypogaeus]GEM84444.1 ferredoxin [Meiothermus hypogaeus NBRC 106114]GIW35989.1 MAG: ferredoxin [Meiothermus sp.]
MAHVICEPCVGAKHRDCIAVCPVDCIHPKLEEDQGEVMLFINPDECIDCGACVPACPVAAIFIEQDVPPQWQGYIEKNRDYFALDRASFQAKWGIHGEIRP